MRRALVHVTSVRCLRGHHDKTKTSCNASRTLHLSGAKSSCSAPIWGFVCVCTVLGHERRGSLPITCCSNFTCQVTCQFTAGGMAVLFLAMPTKLWNLTGRESGRRFLHLQYTWSAWALEVQLVAMTKVGRCSFYQNMVFKSTCSIPGAISACVADMWHAFSACVADMRHASSTCVADM